MFALFKTAGLMLGVTLASSAWAYDESDLSRLLATRECPFCDLSGASLIGVDLRAAVLVGADLSSAVLFDADLGRANLTGADLTGAALDGAYLEEAILDAADFTNATMDGAYVRRASFHRTNLTGVHLFAVEVESVDMSTVVHRGASTPEQDLATLRQTRSCLFCNLSQMDLTRADFAGADLTGADLHFSLMNGIDLSGANLTGATLAGSSMISANLAGANLAATDLRGTTLWQGNLSGVTFAYTNVTDADMNAAKLDGADMSRTIDRAAPPPPPPAAPVELATHAPALGRIFLVAYAGCPGFAHPADGTLFQIQDHPALYSLLGNTYGGDSRTDFALPDLSQQAPVAGTHFCVVMVGPYPSRN